MPVRPSQVVIFQVNEISDELYQACKHLVPQLTSNHPAPTFDQLAAMIESPGSYLYQAKDLDQAGQIIGLATLIVYQVPTGVRGYIEDVIVDEPARGRRIGEALTQACMDQAKRLGAAQVMLTSNPKRTAANRLYQRMGFELHKTNVYQYKFDR